MPIIPALWRLIQNNNFEATLGYLSQIEDLNENLLKLKEALKTSKNRENLLTDNLNDLHNELQRKQKAYTKILREKDGIDQENDELKRQIKRLSSGLQSKPLIDNKQSLIEELQKKVKKLESQLERKVDEVDIKPMKEKSAREELIKWEEGKKWQTKIEGIRNKLKEKEGEVFTLTKQLNTLKDLFAKADKEKITLQRKLKSTGMTVDQVLGVRALESEKELEELKKRNLDLENDILYMSYLQVVNWHMKIEELRLQELKLNRELVRDKEEIKYLNNIISEYEQTINSLEEEIVQQNKFHEERQMAWDQREVELERQLDIFDRQQNEILNAAQKFEEATGSMPDPSLTLPNQLEIALKKIKENVRTILETRATCKSLEEKLKEKESALRLAEQNILSRDKVINELRLRLPATAEREKLIADLSRREMEPKSHYTMKIAHQTIINMQARLNQKDEILKKYQHLLEKAREEQREIVKKHEEDLHILHHKLELQADSSLNKFKQTAQDLIKQSPTPVPTNKHFIRLAEMEQTVAEQDNSLSSLLIKLEKISQDLERQKEITDLKVKEFESIKLQLQENHACEVKKVKAEVEDLRCLLAKSQKESQSLKSELQAQKEANSRAPTTTMRNLVDRLKSQLALKEKQQKALSRALLELRTEMTAAAEERIISITSQKEANLNVQQVVDRHTRELKEMAVFKIAALQKVIDNSVSLSELELANKQYNELTAKYRDILQKDNMLVQRTSNLEHIEHENASLKEQMEYVNKELEITKEKLHTIEQAWEQETKLGNESKMDKATKSVTNSDIVSISKKITMLEMKELNERQRAEHCQKMYEHIRTSLKQMEERNFELETKFAELTKINLDAQKVEQMLRDELADSVSKAVSDADRQRILELEKNEMELKVEVSKLREISDIAKRQVEFLNTQQQSREKEVESLRMQLLDYQAQSDEKALIAKLHQHIVSLQISEVTALGKLESVTSKLHKIEAYNLRIEQKLDEKEQALYYTRLEGRNRAKHLRQTIQSLRRQFSGALPLAQQEKFSKTMIQLQNDKLKIMQEMKNSQQERRNMENKTLEMELKLKGLEELISTLKDARGAQKVNLSLKFSISKS
uniref:Centrosomal protein of 290 kDa-like n=1 Tax=Castor canadensis TaxID=51338 RepID=A0A8B7UE75_CASCN|nr:centrosomal protein of 290 kDa-like [Castor canadensis]